MDLCNPQCSSGRPDALHGNTFLHLREHENFSINIFPYPPSLLATIDFHHFVLLLETLMLARGHKVSPQAKALRFIFSHIFQLIRMKFHNYGVEAIQDDQTDTTFLWDVIKQGK